MIFGKIAFGRSSHTYGSKFSRSIFTYFSSAILRLSLEKLKLSLKASKSSFVAVSLRLCVENSRLSDKPLFE